MEHISLLIIRAKKQANKNRSFIVLGKVDYDTTLKKYVLTGRIDDNITFYSKHNTEKEAIAECEKIASEYEESNCLCFVMDYGDSFN